MVTQYTAWDWGIVVTELLDTVPTYSIYDIVELVEERVGRLHPEDKQTVMAIYNRVTLKRQEFEPGLPAPGELDS